VVVRNTPGVTGFVSSEDKDGKLVPVPLEEEKVKAILQRMEKGIPRIKVGFLKGESVRITSGPFADFVGVVDEIYPEKGKIKVMVSFFGRETPIELDMLEVSRI
jgi:transcriptional antiterminator NusG